MQYLYGPVPSRRLGQSLGVDPVPLKTCNWNCVYCQLGRSIPLVGVRSVYVPTDELVAELVAYFAAEDHPQVDWVTFVGSGEPTLHSEIGRMLRAAKTISPAPVGVITNGTLLYDPNVRRDLAVADLVMPTLCAGDSDLYRRIHRPHPQATFARHMAGLKAFRAEYTGIYWLEIMLLQGVNDDEAALTRLASVIGEIAPDEVQITIPSRPPSEPWVTAPDADGIMRAVALLGQGMSIGQPVVSDLSFCADTVDGLVEEIWAILVRHPLSDEQVDSAVARVDKNLVEAVRTRLEADPRIQRVVRHGVVFWAAKEAHFVADTTGEEFSSACSALSVAQV